MIIERTCHPSGPDHGVCGFSGDESGDITEEGLCVDCMNSTVPGLYFDEVHCPYPEREYCEGCPRYIEDEDICDMEL